MLNQRPQTAKAPKIVCHLISQCMIEFMVRSTSYYVLAAWGSAFHIGHAQVVERKFLRVLETVET